MALSDMFRRAKKVVDERGGTEALKADAQEIRDIAKGPGTLADKAKAAAGAIKDEGAKGPDAPVGSTSPQAEPRPPEDRAK